MQNPQMQTTQGECKLMKEFPARYKKYIEITMTSDTD